MDIETILIDVKDKVTESRGIVDGLAINQHHAEVDIKELKDDLKVFKEVIWDKVNKNKDLITELDKNQGEIKLKLGLVPKLLMALATLLSIISMAIAILN